MWRALPGKSKEKATLRKTTNVFRKIQQAWEYKETCPVGQRITYTEFLSKTSLQVITANQKPGPIQRK